MRSNPVIAGNVNSFGLRDDEESLVRAGIIVPGISHAMGNGVEDQEAFPQVFEQSLSRNPGISSVGTARELMLLRLLDMSAAGVIAIQYCENDFEENRSLLQHGKLPSFPRGNIRQWFRRRGPAIGYLVFRRLGNSIVKLVHPAERSGRNIVEANVFLDLWLGSPICCVAGMLWSTRRIAFPRHGGTRSCVQP